MLNTILATNGQVSESEKAEFIEKVLARKKDSAGKKIAGLKPRESRLISDKSLADVVEAIIGCFLLQGGQESALRVMTWFGMELGFSLEEGCWLKPPVNVFSKIVNETYGQVGASKKCDKLLQKVDTRTIENILGYAFCSTIFFTKLIGLRFSDTASGRALSCWRHSLTALSLIHI